MDSNIKKDDEEIGDGVNNKNFVLSIYPSAICKVYDNDEHSSIDTAYIIIAQDGQDRAYSLSQSYISEDDAWFKIAESFRHKMLGKLEHE